MKLLYIILIILWVGLTVALYYPYNLVAFEAGIFLIISKLIIKLVG